MELEDLVAIFVVLLTVLHTIIHHRSPHHHPSPAFSGSDEDYQVMTRGKLLDRIKVELAGGIAVRVAVGEETNFGLPGMGVTVHTSLKMTVFKSLLTTTDSHILGVISLRADCQSGIKIRPVLNPPCVESALC